jgi:hypothetical protein
MAHEFGHIKQFKEHVEKSWEMEPHADFMAGWAMSQYLRSDDQSSNKSPKEFLIKAAAKAFGSAIEEAVSTMFGFGDTAFTSANHHGEPHFRAVMVRAGYESGTLTVAEAFDKGLKWAKLKREPTTTTKQ